MGRRKSWEPSAPEALRLKRAAGLADPTLRSLPYGIGRNTRGKIEMSPASNRHGGLQSFIAAELLRQPPDGIVVAEASIHTDIGVGVPDVVRGSAASDVTYGATTPYPQAREICIEILTPSNSDDETREKMRACLQAGAREVWIAAEAGTVRCFGTTGNSRGHFSLLRSNCPRRSRPLGPDRSR